MNYRQIVCCCSRKSKELGVEISFAISDASGLPWLYRRFGEALVLSITLVGQGHNRQQQLSVKTKDVAYMLQGGYLMAWSVQ